MFDLILPFLAWTIFAAVFVARNETVATGAEIFLLVAIALKMLATAAGNNWIWRFGCDAVGDLKKAEATLPENAKRSVRAKIVYDYIDRHRGWWTPFGLLEWKWRAIIDRGLESHSCCTYSFCGVALSVLRLLLFRFEALMVAVAAVLVMAPYSADGEFRKVTSPPEWLAMGIIVPLIPLVILMGMEILIGNAIMGRGYSHYFHLQLLKPAAKTSSHEFLNELFYFTRLLFFSVIGLSAACFAYYACRGSFSEIIGGPPTGLGSSEYLQRVKLFMQFFSFVLVTFSTVGYGDIYPTGAGSRLLVGTIHLLSMAYLLFLLQVLLSGRSVQCKCHSGNAERNSSHAGSGGDSPLCQL
ncbi:potassium channel family protein [Planctomicrobium piriforme]|uniref:Ion channel n=1 Tax=Planctomicrobium piriforme TaxID=1576369 RepID=A0A1I3THQ2_9PLAN|nr:potassium channel family protein [Planctomicrobium piriforme]SFJ70708.1 Ion channel [Planctomicrobium piriforme]